MENPTKKISGFFQFHEKKWQKYSILSVQNFKIHKRS